MSRKRRGRGEGGAYQRKDGRWEASVSMGYVDGKRRRVSVYGATKAEALEARAEKMRELGDAPEQTSNFTLSSYLTHWLKTKTLASNTTKIYKRAIARVDGHRIGRAKLTAVRPSELQALYGTVGGGRVPSQVHEMIRAALNQAVSWGYLKSNPADGVEPPAKPERDIEPMTNEQLARFLDVAQGDRYLPLFVVAASTGMREGELLALTWRDVDLKRARLQVRHTLVEIDGKHEVSDPKTRKSKRPVELPRAAAEALTSHRKAMMAEGHIAGPVFCDTRGGWVRISNLARRHFKPLLEKVEAGLSERIRFHDLRHGLATYLLEADVHPAKVAALLGHASARVTMQVYSHVTANQLRDVADKTDSILEIGRQLAVKPDDEKKV